MRAAGLGQNAVAAALERYRQARVLSLLDDLGLLGRGPPTSALNADSNLAVHRWGGRIR